jgi:hypothetical protein
MTILHGVLTPLFELERSPTRFEKVCIDLYREAEGVTLVPTSTTWDRGRDAKSISVGAKTKSHDVILCATLTVDIDQKIEADLKRVFETSQPDRLVYCTTHSLTEHACDKIAAAVRILIPSVSSVAVLGQIQLVALAERYEATIRKHYSGEIQTIERALLSSPSTGSEPEKIGLRLALMSQTGEDARLLRNNLSRRLVLEALDSAGPSASGNLAVKISATLHLPRTIPAYYIDEILSQLETDKLISFSDSKAGISDQGKTLIRQIPGEASSRLLEGRTLVRESIKTLSGHSLTDDEYNKVWDTLQDGLAELFYSQGASIVKMVSTLITGESSTEIQTTRSLLDRLGDRLLPLFTEQTRASEIRQSVIDMFAEKDSRASQWLAQMCSVYVMMCSLGFEALSSQQITATLRSFNLVADTDVVLSLLCEQEDQHGAVVRIVSGWKAMGGKISLASPVLEEVAYHAWISEHSYATSMERLSSMSDDEANHLVGNAFVRTFRIVARGLTDPKHWHQYVSAFRGESERDYGPILHLLREEHGFTRLQDPAHEHNSFSNRVAEFISQRIAQDYKIPSEDLDFKQVDKCRRDGILLAGVLAARQAGQKSGSRETVLVLSSSKLLKAAGVEFRDSLGKPDSVVSPAALSCLLTLVPGVPMGLTALRSLLFDDNIASRWTPMQRYAYNLIQASGQFHLPWSQRVTLQRELGHRILKDARSSGEPAAAIRDRILRNEDTGYSASVVVDALDRMAVPTETEKEMLRLRGEVDKLKTELERQKKKVAELSSAKGPSKANS